MQNELLQAIDTIDESVVFAEMETVSALAETYVKSLCILEASDETIDLSSFDIFQEGIQGKISRELNAGYSARNKESMLKKIILFIPRLIYKLLKISLFIVGMVIGFLTLPITVPIGKAVVKSATKKIEKDAEVDLELDFDPDYIGNGMNELTELVDLIAVFYNDMYGDGTLSASIDAVWPQISKKISPIKKFIKDFDKEAYKKTVMSKAEAKINVRTFKVAQRYLKRNISKMEKLSRKELKSDKILEEHKQQMSEVMQVLSDWTKKNSELAKKLQEIKQDIANEKGVSVFKSDILADAEPIEAEKINDGDLDDLNM